MNDRPENNSPPPGKDLSLPLLLLAGLGFIPVLGLPFALGTILWGLAIRKKDGAKLIVLGVGGPFLSTAVLAGFIKIVSPSDEGLAKTMLISRLLGTGEMIETFKNGSGEYPDKLNELAQSTRYLLAYDHSQPEQTSKGLPKQPLFYYQRLKDQNGYYLFSIGADGQPFTADDVLPPPSPALPGLRQPPKS